MAHGAHEHAQRRRHQKWGGRDHAPAYTLADSGKDIPLAGVAHQGGTRRMGTDPDTSVLDTNCKAHDLDNLYVMDGSFFPSNSGVNLALTIIANALRVGDGLRDRLNA